MVTVCLLLSEQTQEEGKIGRRCRHQAENSVELCEKRRESWVGKEAGGLGSVIPQAGPDILSQRSKGSFMTQKVVLGKERLPG